MCDTLIRKKKNSKYSRIRIRIRCFTALLLAISYYISHAREIIDREKTFVKYGEEVEEKKNKKRKNKRKYRTNSFVLVFYDIILIIPYRFIMKSLNESDLEFVTVGIS